MAKPPKRIPSGGGMGGFDPSSLMRQMQKMQQDMETARNELEHETTEVSMGGGAVNVVINGHQRIQSITLNKDMIDTSDSEWLTDLQDLLTAALNKAIEDSQTMAAQKMENITGGLGNVPGLGGLLG
jgi:nucleoid-associated protein EbfC